MTWGRLFIVADFLLTLLLNELVYGGFSDISKFPCLKRCAYRFDVVEHIRKEPWHAVQWNCRQGTLGEARCPAHTGYNRFRSQAGKRLGGVGAWCERGAWYLAFRARLESAAAWDTTESRGYAEETVL
jgi:hypothetical protein